mmetsp:Transcript_22732/g.47185  ORF Transcript_22732/g.47185 Transcript_22732/m.47185 type:complete len:136 (-) Transcript_22732:1661-2068(-)|eukprot:CAMPEP_0178666210 /NCGR_PEP_ID=MMETSP0698-20121128/30366_1 /TAXON_ID=265572 /ORGANISM="Extubocellulus spinifer, Strain CCMP396" /LENGTH=135 /DNA_ID=CAMNT_0020309577 /DNA_START=39 /DNA_END=446 /DNA_ORIENTATION=+
MRIATLCCLIAGASAFAPAAISRSSTSLMARVPDEDRTPEMKEIYDIADRWAEIRLYSDEEAKEKLSGEELEAYERYNAKVKEDIKKAQELALMMAKSVEIPQVAKKSKTQRKKDAWAKKQAVAAANAAAEAANV